MRTDEYGGGIEKRARFVLEVAEQVGRAIRFDRLGIRLSPFGVFNDMPLYDDMESDYTYVTKKLGELGLLYVHIVDHSSMGAPEVPASMKASIRKVFPGAVVLSGGYDPVRALEDLDADRGDLVAVAKAFLANPDLPARWEKGAALNAPDMGTFYTPGAKGYTDYPTM